MGAPPLLVGGGRPGEIDEPVMRKMAKETGGEYFYASDSEKLLEVFENLSIQLHDDGIDETSLRQLAEETGGKYYYADADHLGEAFQKVSDDLRTQYLLAYYPERRLANSDFRTISVTLKQPANAHYTVRHRTGYYAAPGQ